MSSEKLIGTVKFVNFDKKFGFIQIEDSEDIFFSLGDVFDQIAEGDQVSFELRSAYNTKTNEQGVKAHNIENLTTRETLNKINDNVIPLKSEPVAHLRNSNALHLYMPWNPSYIKDQMYQLKNTVEKNGHAWIPKFNKTKGKQDLDTRIIDKIKQQLLNGVETCIYMTNFKSIHVWKLSEIIYSKDFEKEVGDYFLEDYRRHDLEGWWFKVEDMFIITADHDGRLDPILTELEELCICEDPLQPVWNEKKKVTPYMSGTVNPAPIARRNEEFIFPGVIKEKLKANKSQVRKSKWLNTHRRVTREYALMEEHLKKKNYPDDWESLSRPTQHMLTEFEMLRIESSVYTSKQRMRYLRQAFECYLSATLNQLEQLIRSKLRFLFNNGFDKERKFKNLQTFNEINNLGNAPDLPFYIENILGNENLKKEISRFTFENVKTKTTATTLANTLDYFKDSSSHIRNLLFSIKQVRNFFAHNYFEVMTNPKYEKDETITLETCETMSSIINSLAMPIGQYNVFFALSAIQQNKEYILKNPGYLEIKNLTLKLKKVG